MVWPSSLGVGQGANNPTIKFCACYEIFKRLLEWVDSLAQPKHWKMDMRLETWNVRSLCRTGLLKMIARGLVKCKLRLSGVCSSSDDRRVALNRQRIVHFPMENLIRSSGMGFFVYKKIISASRRIEFLDDRMSYVIIGGCWCNIIILNVHAPCENKSDDVKDNFC
jgi:hypothetical protein